MHVTSHDDVEFQHMLPQSVSEQFCPSIYVVIDVNTGISTLQVRFAHALYIDLPLIVLIRVSLSQQQLQLVAELSQIFIHSSSALAMPVNLFKVV